MAETKQNQQEAGTDFFADEPLLNAPAGVEARIAALIAPMLAQMGFRLVRLRLLGLNGLTLQIMAERFDGSMTIEDCELLSRNISPLLDVEDVIDRHYNLEISSPGMDRPLVRKSDFSAWRGHSVKIETHSPIGGRKKFHGTILTVEGEYIILQYTAKEGFETEAEIPFALIAEANLILTDELIRAVLQQDKQKSRELATRN